MTAARRMTSPTALILLMAASLLINYVDRGNLATAAAQLTADLHLSATQYGGLLAAFYVSYTFSQIPSGALADRFGGKLVLGAGAALWSLSTLLTGLVASYPALIALRVMLGMGESVAFTATSKMIAANVPPSRIGMANGVIGFGYMVGPAVGTLVGGMLMAEIGWRSVFVLFGVLSLVWLVPWSRVRIHEPRATRADAGQIPLSRIVRQRALWGAALGHFAGNWNFYFVLGYLPLYLQKGRGLSQVVMAQTLSSAYLVNALAAFAAGWLVDRQARRGRLASPVHKWLLALAHVVGLAAMLAIPVLPLTGCLAALFAYEVFLGASSPSYFIVGQEFAGPRAAARWIGFQNMVGNLPGIIGLAFAGLLIDASGGSYFTAFALAAAVNVLGLLGWVVIMPRVQPVDWERT